MAIPTTQLFSRQEALMASGVPKSIDSFAATTTAAAYTVPAGTKLITLSTDVMCLFRDGEVAATAPTGQTDGEEAAWLHPGQDRTFRVQPGQTISFRATAADPDANITIERYTGTNATLPPD